MNVEKHEIFISPNLLGLLSYYEMLHRSYLGKRENGIFYNDQHEEYISMNLGYYGGLLFRVREVIYEQFSGDIRLKVLV